MIRHLDLFSGIAGFSIASDYVWGNVDHTFCDIDPYSQGVIKHYYPKSKVYADIKELKGSELGTVDLVTGGFPCQPFSSAGKRRGTQDDRHLWPEMLRVIRETNPRWIIGENVSGLVTWDGGMVLEGVLSDLEAIGYKTLPPIVIPACAYNAPHRRDRVWIVAYSDRDADRGRSKKLPKKDERKKESGQKERVLESSELHPIRTPSDTASIGHGGGGNKECAEGEWHMVSRESKGHPVWNKDERRSWNAWPQVASILCAMDDGLSPGLALTPKERTAMLKGAGNSIVPQIAAQIMKAIKETGSI